MNIYFAPEKPGLQKLLGPLETEIMETIWQQKNLPVSVATVHQAIRQYRRIAYTTVMTTMTRMTEKELLTRITPTQRGRIAYEYIPRWKTRQDFVQAAIQHISQGLQELKELSDGGKHPLKLVA